MFCCKRENPLGGQSTVDRLWAAVDACRLLTRAPVRMPIYFLPIETLSLSAPAALAVYTFAQFVLLHTISSIQAGQPRCATR